MGHVTDYRALEEAAPEREGEEVLVESSGFIYFGSRGRWVFARRQAASR
jgi:hypothetical protein